MTLVLTLALGHDNALAACYRHDSRCAVQAGERPAVSIGAMLGCYPTAGGAHVTVTTTAPDTATDAPGWVAECGGCGWSDDQFACWHELWPAYPAIADGDVRGLLLDTAQEHADTCEAPTGGAR
jgi:hypothetical protein